MVRQARQCRMELSSRKPESCYRNRRMSLCGADPCSVNRLQTVPCSPRLTKPCRTAKMPHIRGFSTPTVSEACEPPVVLSVGLCLIQAAAVSGDELPVPLVSRFLPTFAAMERTDCIWRPATTAITGRP